MAMVLQDAENAYISPDAQEQIGSSFDVLDFTFAEYNRKEQQEGHKVASALYYTFKRSVLASVRSESNACTEEDADFGNCLDDYLAREIRHCSLKINPSKSDRVTCAQNDTEAASLMAAVTSRPLGEIAALTGCRWGCRHHVYETRKEDQEVEPVTQELHPEFEESEGQQSGGGEEIFRAHIFLWTTQRVSFVRVLKKHNVVHSWRDIVLLLPAAKNARQSINAFFPTPRPPRW